MAECAVGSGDGLIDPSQIPGDELDPGKIAAAADALTAIAANVTQAADDVVTAWSPMTAAFIAPDAHLIHTGMKPVASKSRGFANRLTKVAHALHAYAAELGPIKRALAQVKAEAEQWRAEEFDLALNVWVLAHRTKKYEWDIHVSKVNIVSDPVEYLRSRGETVREGWWGYPEIKAYWRESGDHVTRNNELLDKVADAYAKLQALQVECANTISQQRDSAIESLVAIDAEVLKGTGENAVALPWGRQAEHDRTCPENFGQGMKNTGMEMLSLLNLVSIDVTQDHWFGHWDLAGEAWVGLGTGLGSLAIATNPTTAVLGALGVPVLSDGVKNTQEMAKSLVSWDKWASNPAEAAGEVTAGLIPLAGWAGKGSKASIAARAAAARGIAERAIAKATAAGARITELFGKIGNPKPFGGGTSLFDNLVHGRSKVDTSAPVSPHTGHLDTTHPDTGIRPVKGDTDIGGRVPEHGYTGKHIPEHGPGSHAEAPAGGAHGTHTEGSVSPGHRDSTSGNDHTGGSTAPHSDSGSPHGGQGSGGVAGSDTGYSTDGKAGSGPGWERIPAADEPGVKPGDGTGRPYPDDYRVTGDYPVRTGANEQTWNLVADPEAPYGRGPQEVPYTKEEFDIRFAKTGPEGEKWWRYPPNDGAVPDTRIRYHDPAAFLEEYGTRLDRIGEPDGKYLGVFENGKPPTFEQRALPPDSLDQSYYTYTFAADAAEKIRAKGHIIEVSRAAEGFGRPGGALQLRIHGFNARENSWEWLTVQDMIDKGYLIK